MAFHVSHQDRTLPFRAQPTMIWRLEGDGESCVAEIAPEMGFNCIRWCTTVKGQTTDWLYADPQVFPDGRPTRSGIPILFPFPNRIRDGRYTWYGKEYQLPLLDSTGQHAIHGFVCRRPWQVVNSGANDTAAWLTGEFRGSHNAPETQAGWPADYRLRLTYTLLSDRLRLDILVQNPDRVALPWGLGLHPYFRVQPRDQVQVPALACWQLHNSLPTGSIVKVDGDRDLNRPKLVGSLTLDDVLTDLQPMQKDPDTDMLLRGWVGRIRVWTAPEFREMVVFTPSHRQAMCLEPYTCTTDAIRLKEQGIDGGLKVLYPGQSWRGAVAFVLGGGR
jgi:aldose 1-epimerase